MAALRLADDLEIPGIEPPALRPIMQRGAANSVHHGMHSHARRIGSGCIRPVRGNFLICFLRGLRPAAKIIAQLIGREVALGEPRARFEADHFEPGLGQWQSRRATRGAEADDYDVGFPLV